MVRAKLPVAFKVVSSSFAFSKEGFASDTTVSSGSLPAGIDAI